VVILVFFCATSLFLLCRSLASIGHTSPAATQGSQSALRALLAGSFNLFPPNAAISLTEDNSTSFPGRPAAYGPPLPNKGISGLLWIGIGFAGGGDGAEGELGCSDVPGWDDKPSSNAAKAATDKAKALHRGEKAAQGSATSKAGRILQARGDAGSTKHGHHLDDGTDDYLHEEIQGSDGKALHHVHSMDSPGSRHADIQSLQEAAEISGKIVLLSRGGCGFLEKTMWAQRRGAIALIVGDNMRGGPLIQMFAHGNVDNVSIPSVFTSRTTAHLLSSLVEAGNFGGEIIDDSGHPVLKVQHTDRTRKSRKVPKQPSSQPGSTKAGQEPKAIRYERTAADNRRSTEMTAETVSSEVKSSSDGDSTANTQGGGLLSKLFGDDDGADFESPPPPEKEKDNADDTTYDYIDQLHELGDGLWVTITPTRSGIPFFDTLVLVLISPMITLALVYGLLSIRGYVRRRRWRAPKDLVARLPVRTYHTAAEDSDDSDRAFSPSVSRTRPPHRPSSRVPFPSSLASPTTPLLQAQASRLSPRPRSNTTTAVPDGRLRPGLQVLGSSSNTHSMRTSSRTSQVEKGAVRGNPWKRFKGRQLECVICLDEFVDGVTKVMSLPCGHEYHVDCM
jgi:hypothetical protein